MTPFFGGVVHANTQLGGDIEMNGFCEPMNRLAVLVARTKNIGLLGTISTSFSEPYSVARQLAGLDNMSGGRAGWNIVTSNEGFKTYGYDEALDPATRYRRATEFVDVVRQLWDSRDDGAVINDRSSGEYSDRGSLHRIDHEGEFYSVEGPLNMPTGPQRHLVLAPAGWSGPGMELGSLVGDIMSTARPLKEPSIEFYARFEEMSRSTGRNPTM